MFNEIINNKLLLPVLILALILCIRFSGNGKANSYDYGANSIQRITTDARKFFEN